MDGKSGAILENEYAQEFGARLIGLANDLRKQGIARSEVRLFYERQGTLPEMTAVTNRLKRLASELPVA